MPQFARRDIFQKVSNLNFPHPEGVMITHGSALRARDVIVERDMDPEYKPDIDLVVTKPNMNHIVKNLGWSATRQLKYYAEDLPENIRCIVSPDGEFDVFSHDFMPKLFEQTGRGRVYPEVLFALHNSKWDQDDETGIYVASLDFVELTKQTTRPKDISDIRRSMQFQMQHY